MMKTENECVGCRIPCIDCGLRRVPHFYCDNCGEEAKPLYKLDDEELCAECVLDSLGIVEGTKE